MYTAVVDGSKYSFKFFEEYTHRAKIKLTLSDGEDFTTDVYTTQDRKDLLELDLLEKFGDKVTNFEITYWTTRSADDAQSALLNEWLNEEKE